MASILFEDRERRRAVAWHGMQAGRLLTPVLALLGLILPSANVWAQG